MAGSSCESIKWYLNQVKVGNKSDSKEADIFTCLEFDDSGDYLAAGDKSGRIFVFNGSGEKIPTYNIFCAFTSHEPEFDYLKSLEIDEKINSICWLPSVNNSLHLLSTNDKIVKMWRMSEQSPSAYNFNFRVDNFVGGSGEESDCISDAFVGSDKNVTCDAPLSHNLKNEVENKPSTSLRIPRYRKSKNLTIEVRPRKVYANAHTYHINSISVNSDQETFLSADDLRINLWHMDVSNQSFTIVDLKPDNMEELSEVITCSRFHPELCNMFGYSTSRGVIRLCDMRAGALCDNHVLVLEDPALSQTRGFFGDIISSISDFRYDHSGNFILARDYLNLKVWDIRKCDQPRETYAVHEPLRYQLCMLYETEAIFDKFLCSWSEDDRYVVTGSYGYGLRVFDRFECTDWVYDLDEPGVRPTVNSALPSGETATLSCPRLRPHNLHSRLLPKRFVAPESELGSQFQIKSVFLAHATPLETLTVPPQDEEEEEEVASSAPVIAGSKRRKQTLPPSLPTTRHSPDDGDEDGAEENSSDDGNDAEEKDARITNINGRSPLNMCIAGLRELNYKRRFTQLAWHPQCRMVAAVGSNEIFLCHGKEASPHMFPQNNVVVEEEEEEDAEEESLGEEREIVETTTTFLNSPLDVKAAKRRRKRKQCDDSGGEETSDSDKNKDPHVFADSMELE